MLAIVPSLWKMEPLEDHLLAGGPPIRRVPIPGVTDVVAIWDREDVKKVFTARPDLVPAGEFQVRILGGFGPESLMMVEGERHMRLRKFLLPPFHGAALDAYSTAVEEVTREVIEGWPEGEEHPVHPSMYRIVLDVLLKKVVGVSDRARADRLRALLPGVLESSALTFIVEGRFPSLGYGTSANVLPWIRSRRQAEVLLREEVAAHRASPTDQDVLGMLMSARDEAGEGLTDEELVDQMITLLVAGHQTTGATLAWCFERVTRHPAVLSRLTREVRDGDYAYLDAVLKETQRVRPAVEVVFRELAEPMELSGYVVPKGTIVMPLIRLVQESDDSFPDADEFVPERWLDGKSPPYSWIPYGGGTRRCVGSAFANLEMRIVVATILDRYDLALAKRGPERRARARIFTTIPGRGARVTVRSRVAPPAAVTPAQPVAPVATG